MSMRHEGNVLTKLEMPLPRANDVALSERSACQRHDLQMIDSRKSEKRVISSLLYHRPLQPKWYEKRDVAQTRVKW